MREKSNLQEDTTPTLFPTILQPHERLDGRKIAKIKKAVRMKNNTW